MSFGICNTSSLYRAGSLTAAAREFETCKLDLVGQGGTARAGNYIFHMENETKNHQSGTEFFLHHRIVSAVHRSEFVSDRMPYTVLR